MRLRSVTLRNFRNHTDTSIDCSAGHNILVGRNGEGKTNILEAISYLCLGRSFYASSDTIVLKHGADGFSVRGTFEAERGVVYSVEAAYTNAPGGRKVRVGGADLPRRADLIGMFPVVVLSPDNAPITSGGPGERRRMVDTTLAQAHRPYLEDVIEYRKALRQRNRLLSDARSTRRLDEGALAPWTDVLVERGARMTQKRRDFVREFQPYVTAAVSRLSGAAEAPTITYQPSIGDDTEEKARGAEDIFRERLRNVLHDEARAGTTLVGPHRDEFDLEINGLSVRQYASQGQHKTFLVGLKFAELHFLREACGETPLMLLDDVLSELDPERNGHVFELTRDVGQVFITAADPRLLSLTDSKTQNVLHVRGGSVAEESDANT